MSGQGWEVDSFPRNFNFAFGYSKRFSSPAELSNYLEEQINLQKEIADKLRIAPTNALSANLNCCIRATKKIKELDRQTSIDPIEAIAEVDQLLNQFATTETLPMALIQSKWYMAIIEGGCVLSNHFNVSWIDDKYGWDFTLVPFNKGNWHHAARALDLEDILDHSRGVIRQLNAEIEEAKVTKETIHQHSSILDVGIADIKAQAKRNIDDFATAVMDRKALESPGQNWQEKERTHNRNALLWFLASVLWLGLVITGGLLGTNWIAERSVTTTSTVAAVSNPTPPTDKPAAPDAQGVNAADKPVVAPAMRERLDTPLAIVFITTYVLLAISIFRFMTRQFQLEQRLADDARQRRTMMNSYLALLEHQSNPIRPEERLLVLQVLFRGTALTEANDDVSPANLMDALVTAVLKRDGKSPGS